MDAAQEDGLWRAVGQIEGDLGAQEQQIAELRRDLADIRGGRWAYRIAICVLAGFLFGALRADLPGREYIAPWIGDVTCRAGHGELL